jgi:hypothetical protein
MFKGICAVKDSVKRARLRIPRGFTREKSRGCGAPRDATYSFAAPTSSSGRPEENARGAYRPAALRFGVLPTRLQDRASETRRTSFEVPSAPLGHRDFQTQAFLPAHRGSPFQPSKAAAHSGRGRLPKASPGYGCEPRPEAPAVSRNSNASRCALDGNGKRNIVLVIRKVKRISFIVIAGLDPAIHTAEMPGGWLYILASRPRGTLYVGVTNNLVRRMDEHRSGMNELLLGTASTIWCSSNNTRLCRWRSSVRRTSSTGRAIGRFS